MNYFEKHIGDWIRDTVSLTMLEDGAYNRLIDQYYQTERPIPIERKLIYRLARANSSAEKKAVDFVIENFFEKTENGYVQKRASSELARYSEKRAKAQASANARWNKSEGNANASANASLFEDANDMRTHCDGNAHQAPVASNQSPVLKPLGETAPVEHLHARPAEISAAMRKHGIEAQPADPRIIAASEAGYSVETIDAACSEAKAAKPNERISPLYVLRIAERWTRDAAAPRAAPVARPGFTNARDESRKRAYEVLTGKTPTEQSEVQPAEVINGHIKLIG